MKKQRIFIGLLVLGLLLTLAAGTKPISPEGAGLHRPWADFDGDGYADLAIGVPYDHVGAIAHAGAVNVLYGSWGYGLDDEGDQIWHQDSPGGIWDMAEADDHFGYALAVGDFDGDGHFDLAVGVPYENVGSISNAGAVHVLYGSDGSGLTATGNQFWYQGNSGIQDIPEAGDNFGWSLAAGDFDGDGYADLAVGVPYEGWGTYLRVGVVHVLYGSSGDGLTATGNQVWHQDSPNVEGGAEADDSFGWSLAAGDFDGDGYDDLAVGVRCETIASPAWWAGAVNVLYGSSGVGLTAAGNQMWHQDSLSIADWSEAQDHFGEVLAAGDFDGDGYDDLAVGVPQEDLPLWMFTMTDAGAVNVLYGSSGDGLTDAGNQVWHQYSPNVEDTVEAQDRFGYALAAGDFDGDGYDDLAVGVPGEAIGTLSFAGAVNVLYGSSGTGLTATGNQIWHQDSPNVWDMAEADDWFGYALAAGDFDGDGYADLAVGVPYEDIASIVAAGAVNVLYGSSGSGLTAVGNQFWHRNWPEIEGSAEAGDFFGYALAAIPSAAQNKVYLPLILSES